MVLLDEMSTSAIFLINSMASMQNITGSVGISNILDTIGNDQDTHSNKWLK